MTEKPASTLKLHGRSILITGGASGLGAAFAAHWTSLGATVIIGDVDEIKGRDMVRSIQDRLDEFRSNDRSNSDEELDERVGNIHFIYCDVASWASQVNMFKRALVLSPCHKLDTVVANAGIMDKFMDFDTPTKQSMLGNAAAGSDDSFDYSRSTVPEPKEPNLRTIEVNLIGTLYTAHLASFYVNTQRNCKSHRSNDAVQSSSLLLVGSIASLRALPGHPLYTASKHALLGLFRSLLHSAPTRGLTVDLLCPYLTETPMMTTAAKVVLAGIPKCREEDVVDAATRLIGDCSVTGRALAVLPSTGHQEREYKTESNENSAIWDISVDEYEEAEPATRRLMQILNWTKRARGCRTFFRDLFASSTITATGGALTSKRLHRSSK